MWPARPLCWLRPSQSARQQNFVYRIPEVAAAQVLTLLRQGNLAAAAQLAQTHELPISQARVHLAQGDPSAALAVLEPLRQQMEAKGWQDERLKVMVLQAVAHHAHGEKDKAVQLLGDALALAEPGGFIRIFVDEGEPMRLLISDFRWWIEKQSRDQDHNLSGYVDKLLAAFARAAAMPQSKTRQSRNLSNSRAIEPARAGNPAAHCPGALEPRDRRAAFPRPGYGQRAQPQNL